MSWPPITLNRYFSFRGSTNEPKPAPSTKSPRDRHWPPVIQLSNQSCGQQIKSNLTPSQSMKSPMDDQWPDPVTLSSSLVFLSVCPMKASLLPRRWLPVHSTISGSLTTLAYTQVMYECPVFEGCTCPRTSPTKSGWTSTASSAWVRIFSTIYGFEGSENLRKYKVRRTESGLSL